MNVWVANGATGRLLAVVKGMALVLCDYQAGAFRRWFPIDEVWLIVEAT